MSDTIGGGTMTAQKNGFVRWFHLVPALILLSLGLAGYVNAIASDSMSKDVFVQFEKRFEEFRDEQKTGMKRLLDEIKGLKK